MKDASLFPNPMKQDAVPLLPIKYPTRFVFSRVGDKGMWLLEKGLCSDRMGRFMHGRWLPYQTALSPSRSARLLSQVRNSAFAPF